ncbi:hypothetical protein [Streptomyces chattanoogensis]|uniref:hypothetical protein n=1 Tax=Streptomyces chattanoogensis TaxID=66876 RepID=UPI0036CE8386
MTFLCHILRRPAAPLLRQIVLSTSAPVILRYVVYRHPFRQQFSIIHGTVIINGTVAVDQEFRLRVR